MLCDGIRVAFFLSLIFSTTSLFSQKEGVKKELIPVEPHFDFGGSMLFGIARIGNEGSLSEYFSKVKEQNVLVTEKTFKIKWGTIYGFQVLVTYVFSNRFHLNTGMGFHRQQNRVELFEKQEFSSGSYHKTSSVASLSASSFGLPVIAKIRFLSGEQNPFGGEIYPFLKTGVFWEKRISSSLSFDENHIVFNGGKPDLTYKMDFSDAELDGFPGSALYLLIGTGSDFVLFEREKKTFFIDIAFTFPLGAGPLWSSNFSADPASMPLLSDVFHKDTVQEISGKYGISFNDWKSTAIIFTMGVIF